MNQRIRQALAEAVVDEADLARWGYWYQRLPIGTGEIDGPRVSRSTRREFIQELVTGCEHLSGRYKQIHPERRIFALVTLPTMFNSELLVLADDTTYQTFIYRDGPYQFRKPLPPDRSLKTEWRIVTHLAELGLSEVNLDLDDEVDRNRELWLLGDIIS